MADHGEGTKHSVLTGADVVYTKEQCDRELDRKQDRLTAGPGISLKEGVLSSKVSGRVPNRYGVKDVNLGSAYEKTEIEVDDDHHVYVASASSASIGGSDNPFYFKNIEEVGGDDVYVFELWVTVADPNHEIAFGDEFVRRIGDTVYRVDEPGQTIHFACRWYNGTLLVSKYFVG